MRLATPTNSLKLGLAERELVSFIEHGRPLSVRCASGVLWITIEGEAGDLVLRTGEEARLPADRLVVVQALAPSVAAFETVRPPLPLRLAA